MATMDNHQYEADSGRTTTSTTTTIFEPEMGFNSCYSSSNIYNNNHHLNNYGYMGEKRQLFLRSYQFSRKTSVVEKMKIYFLRVKRRILVRLRYALKLRRMIWFRLRYGTTGGCGSYTSSGRRRTTRRFQRLSSPVNNKSHRSGQLAWTSSCSSCW